MTTTTSYSSLEEIQQRKEELKTNLQNESQKIGELWHGLTAAKEPTSKGEMIANIVTNSITAIDAFLLVRKLTKIYGKYFHRKK
ncbi:MAG: hypothetical protein J1E37_05955 [Prevotella sp.]|nr:hypothetical protein [Prevotella sp.]